MTKKKGINRHESLKPLSRHHMIGLHVALKLKRAGTENSRWSIKEILKDTNEFWKPDGQEHFREEEEILLPAYSCFANVDEQPEIGEMLLEHVKIRAGMDAVLSAEPPSLDQMHELGLLLEAHIRKEERVIFPMIERALPEDKLIELAPYLE